MSEHSHPPLISPQSPSYERAWHEFARPVAGAGPELVALLARLSEAEQNAAQICTKASVGLGGDQLAQVAAEHADVHARRREALAKLIEKLGGSAPTDAECRDILAGALDAAARDEAKLALRTMRDELAAEYATATRSKSLSEPQRTALAALAPDAPVE